MPGISLLNAGLTRQQQGPSAQIIHRRAGESSLVQHITTRGGAGEPKNFGPSEFQGVENRGRLLIDVDLNSCRLRMHCS